jgi:hypothetical protein
MDRNDKEKFLTNFSKSYQQMIAANDESYDFIYGSTLYKKRCTKKYTPEEIDNIIEDGSLADRIALSRSYFKKGGFYQRILLHYATLLKYTGLLIPNPSFGHTLSESYVEKKYNNAINFVDKAQLPELFTNIAIAALRDGCYYGIIQTVDKNSVTLIDLPVYYCQTRFKDLSGNDLIEFDVTYFDTIVDQDKRKMALQVYPKQISDWYKKYKLGKVKKWVFIPAEIGICLPFLDGSPAFLNIIPAAIEYDQARDINKERDLEEIRKVIVQKIPHLQDGALLFEPDEAEVMHKGTVKMMKGNPNISVLTTYADVDAVVSKTANDNALNSVDKSLTHIYSESGSSPQLFGTESNLSLETSINNDMALMMTFARKLDKLMTYIINDTFGNSNISFKYTILPITFYNEQKYIDETLKMANSGYSFVLPALAMGLSQRELGNIKDLENDVLGLKEKLVPLSTAYTEPGNDPGRPELPAQEKSAKTIANEESLDGGGSSTNG